MKSDDQLMMPFFSFFIVLASTILFYELQLPVVEESPVDVETAVNKSGSQSIAFILGEDTDWENRFYSNALSYFQFNPEVKADFVIEKDRTLTDIMQTLSEIHEQTGRPFHTIHLVVHSNPWSGMSLPIEEAGARVTAENLEEFLQGEPFVALNEEMLDSSSKIHLHACGLGANERLLENLKALFNGAEIIGSEGYMNFVERNDQFYKREMKVFYAFYPTAYKPADLHLARQLKSRYPEVDKDWLNALRNSSYRYNFPIEWEIAYTEYDMPELNDELDELEWLMNQEELLTLVNDTGISFEDFRWIIKKRADRIKVYGKVTVLCVLEDMKA